MSIVRLIVGSVAILSVLSGNAVAQDAEDEAERLRQIEEQRRANAELAAELRSRTEAEQAALQALQGRLVTTAESLQAAEARLTEIEETLATLSERETRALRDLEARRLELSGVLAALMSLERSRPPALAVSPDDANRAAVAAIALSSITPELADRADEVRRDLDQIAVLRAEMDRERAELDNAETALSERRRLLETLLAEREAAQAEDAARLRALDRENRRLAQEASTLRELIARLADRDGADGPTFSPVIAGGPEVYAALPERWRDARALVPLPAAGVMTTAFGSDLAEGGQSNGIFLRTRAGAVVTAPFRGRVAWAGDFGRIGNVVIIDVGDGFNLVLIGLSDLEVNRGAVVQAGEPLGVMPQGASVELQFQVRQDNQPIDPSPWLRFGVAADSGR